MQITNIRTVEKKSKAHTVEQTSFGYKVTSGTSGITYHVRLHPHATCSCNWSHFHKQGEVVACSHVQAAYRFAEQGEGYAPKFHQLTTDTSKQKRKEIYIGDGVKMLLRRKPAPKQKPATDLETASLDDWNAELFG